MIICVCNSLGERELREACNSSCEKSLCANKIMKSLGCQPVCGQCLCYIDEIAAESARIHV